MLRHPLSLIQVVSRKWAVNRYHQGRVDTIFTIIFHPHSHICTDPNKLS